MSAANCFSSSSSSRSSSAKRASMSGSMKSAADAGRAQCRRRRHTASPRGASSVGGHPLPPPAPPPLPRPPTCNVVAVEDLWHDVVLPLVLLQQVTLAQVRAVDAGAAPLLLRILFRAPLLPGVPTRTRRRDAGRDDRRTRPAIARLRLCHVHPERAHHTPGTAREGGGGGCRVGAASHPSSRHMGWARRAHGAHADSAVWMFTCRRTCSARLLSACLRLSSPRDTTAACTPRQGPTSSLGAGLSPGRPHVGPACPCIAVRVASSPSVATAHSPPITRGSLDVHHALLRQGAHG